MDVARREAGKGLIVGRSALPWVLVLKKSPFMTHRCCSLAETLSQVLPSPAGVWFCFGRAGASSPPSVLLGRPCSGHGAVFHMKRKVRDLLGAPVL